MTTLWRTVLSALTDPGPLTNLESPATACGRLCRPRLPPAAATVTESSEGSDLLVLADS
ncbi:hypothetical protein [Streptomyces parvus]|uniref:hypothetical protein n=1 Tax=Streptomyces parvus TaxID=66428 RepID=UPI001653B628|nr:hypothetical protein [Streptomyces parvus]